MKHDDKSAPQGARDHIPEGVRPAAPVKPKRGFDPAGPHGGAAKSGRGPKGKPVALPGKSRGR